MKIAVLAAVIVYTLLIVANIIIEKKTKKNYTLQVFLFNLPISIFILYYSFTQGNLFTKIIWSFNIILCVGTIWLRIDTLCIQHHNMYAREMIAIKLSDFKLYLVEKFMFLKKG